MILVFGGTTEGRKAAEVLEEGGSTFFYSTKTGEQSVTLYHGRHISGALGPDDMLAFCREKGVRLIVDAAHPFATRLHTTIASTAAAAGIAVVRYERIYPPRDPAITWIDDYSEVPTDIASLLATTGVQSISRLKWLEAEGVSVTYRILDRESSRRLALEQGAKASQLCYYEDGVMPAADAILLKESGTSGGFSEKVAEARARGMRIIALKRPPTKHKGLTTVCNGPYGLRRAVERLLPEFYALHSGLTTGTCATAAAIAAAMRLNRGYEAAGAAGAAETAGAAENLTPRTVPVVLPNGETITVPVGFADGYAFCIKEAGDDPDVTNGLKICATVEPAATFAIEGGEGVGRFTLPGFDYPPGEAAINKGPRQMIRANLQPFLEHPQSTSAPSLRVTISVPGGEAIARRTFNPRLGIVGGISIIGVSGIVKPFSEEAFIDSISKCMDVAKASGADRVVINSGAKSERFLKERYPTLPAQAFVQYGNFIGPTLQMAARLHIDRVTLGVMLGKAVKLAAGHLDTHSRRATMDLDVVAKLLAEADCHTDISNITLARELWERIPASSRQRFADTVIGHCAKHCRPLLPEGELTILLIDDEGNIYP